MTKIFEFHFSKKVHILSILNSINNNINIKGFFKSQYFFLVCMPEKILVKKAYSLQEKNPVVLAQKILPPPPPHHFSDGQPLTTYQIIVFKNAVVRARCHIWSCLPYLAIQQILFFVIFAAKRPEQHTISKEKPICGFPVSHDYIGKQLNFLDFVCGDG